MRVKLNQNEKKILFFEGFLSIVIFFIIIFYSGDKAVLVNMLLFSTASIPITYFTMLSIPHIKKIIKYQKKKKIYAKVKVKKEKPLPLYITSSVITVIFFIILTLSIIILNSYGLEEYAMRWQNLCQKIDMQRVVDWAFIISCPASFLLIVSLMIMFLTRKKLYLCKNNSNVLKYFEKIEILKENDSRNRNGTRAKSKKNLNISNNKDVFMADTDFSSKEEITGARNLYLVEKMHEYLKVDNVCIGYYLYNYCELIELCSGTELWSCYIRELPTKNSEYSKACDMCYIFAITPYEGEIDVGIVLTNNGNNYLDKDNIYISKYSNLPPFILNKQNDEKISRCIEEICSKFFSKTRFKYVLIIENGRICVGLKNATFGVINRVFNKKKTKKLIDEAIQEIESFLLDIRNIIEKW